MGSISTGAASLINALTRILLGISKFLAFGLIGVLVVYLIVIAAQEIQTATARKRAKGVGDIGEEPGTEFLVKQGFIEAVQEKDAPEGTAATTTTSGQDTSTSTGQNSATSTTAATAATVTPAATATTTTTTKPSVPTTTVPPPSS